ncbi:MAG: hypothetical protein WA705_10165 [Candidatus Ozemobacteraceae bacterium]
MNHPVAKLGGEDFPVLVVAGNKAERGRWTIDPLGQFTREIDEMPFRVLFKAKSRLPTASIADRVDCRPRFLRRQSSQASYRRRNVKWEDIIFGNEPPPW